MQLSIATELEAVLTKALEERKAAHEMPGLQHAAALADYCAQVCMSVAGVETGNSVVVVDSPAGCTVGHADTMKAAMILSRLHNGVAVTMQNAMEGKLPWC